MLEVGMHNVDAFVSKHVGDGDNHPGVVAGGVHLVDRHAELAQLKGHAVINPRIGSRVGQTNDNQSKPSRRSDLGEFDKNRLSSPGA